MFKYLSNKIDEFSEKLSVLNPRLSIALFNMGSFDKMLTKYSYTLTKNGRIKLVLTSKLDKGCRSYPAPLLEEIKSIIDNKNQSLLPYINGEDYYFYNVYENRNILIGNIYELSLSEAMAEVLIKINNKGTIDYYV